MTDETQASGAPQQPQQPPPPPPAGGSWQAPPPVQPVPGTAGFVYADVPNRIVAVIIDAIILGVIGLVVNAVLSGILGPAVRIRETTLDDLVNGNINTLVDINYLNLFVSAIVGLAISLAYSVYMWTRMRGTVGMKALGMQVGNFPDGKTLTQNQAIRRWAALWGPGQVGQFLNSLPALGALIGLAGLVYTIFLLYTTAQSPTKQGFHDKFANSVVVKASRTA